MIKKSSHKPLLLAQLQSHKTLNIVFGIFLFIVLSLTLGSSSIFTNTVSAQAGSNNGNALMNDATAPTLRAKSYTYFKVAEKCIKSHMRNTIKTTPGAAGTAGQTTPSQYGAGGSDGTDRGEWFADDDAFGQVYPDGSTKCDRIIQEGIKMWGFESGAAFLRAIGFTFDPNVPQWKSPDNDGNKRFDFFKKAVYGRVGDIEQLAQGAPMHLLYLKAFSDGEPYCNAKKIIKYNDADSTLKQWADSNTRRNSEIYTNVTLVEDKETVKYIYTYAGSGDGDNKTGILWQYRGNGISGPGDGQFRESYKCSEIASRITSTAIALRDWNRQHPENKEDSSSTPPPSNNPTPTDTAPTCTIDGIGWLLCPVFTFLGGITDAAYNFVGGLLTVQPLTVVQSDKGLFGAWSVMRNIANIAFVIAFLIIIFSQLTSVGVSNYGVKKLLPRLVVAAILVNISYWVCAIAVDLSNIAGTSVKGLFEAVGTSIPSTVTAGIDNNLATGGGWAGIIGAVIAGTAVGGTIFYVGLSALIPGLLAAVAAIITVFLVLTLRQALIILLIVIAPLAFVAYLLPNTEDLFHKWRKLLTTLLLMFPIIAGIFGASALAASIVMNASNNVVVQIMGATIAIVPLALTPIVMKAAGGVLNRFGGIINNTEKGPIDRLRKVGSNYREGRVNLMKARGLNGTDKLPGRGAFTRWRGRRQAVYTGRENEAKEAQRDYVAGELGRNPSFATSVAGGDAMKGARLAVKAEASIEAEDLKEALQPLLRELAGMDPGDKRKKLDIETKAGGSRQAAALHYAAQIGDTGFLRNQLAGQDSDGVSLGRTAQQQDEATRRIREAIGANPSSIIGKAPDLVKGDSAAFGSVKGSDLVQFKPDTAKAYMSYIDSLHAKSTAPGATADDIDKYNTAINGFNSAVEDITKSVELQGNFSADVGSALQKASVSSPAAGSLHGLAAIQADGKIR